MTEDIDKFESRSVVPHLPEPVVQTPANMIELAINRGADLDKLEKLMELQQRYEANEAKKAYVAAMAAFKENPPEIYKTKKAGFDHKSGQGRTEYSYADLAEVATAINKGLSKHGLSASWETQQEAKSITVTCIITHAMGHSEKTSLTAAADDSGKKNAIQAIGSTISYLERYTLLALTGLATYDMDDDGEGHEEVEAITEEQKANIETLKKDAIKAKLIKDDKDFGVRIQKLFKSEDATILNLTEDQANKLIKKLSELLEG